MSISSGTGPRSSSGPQSVVFPAKESILSETRKVVGDTDKRQDAAADVAQQDPVIVIELLKAANAMAHSEGKPPVTTTRGAIVRLGATSATEVLDRVKEFPNLENEGLSKLLEDSRTRCTKVGEAARIIASIKAQSLADDCYTAGVLKNVGEMVAIVHLGDDYVKMAEENKTRAKILYRLEKDHNFDTEKMTSAYLRRAGIPESLLFAVDREMQTKTPNRAIMKPIIASAMEMVVVYDSYRWDKIAPDKNLPPKSSVRTLGLSDAQYESLYERVGEKLVSIDPDKLRKLEK